jgi:hypothetical protein
MILTQPSWDGYLLLYSPKSSIPGTRVISNFLKIHGDIRKSRCTIGINDTGGKLWEQHQTADTLN